MTLIYELSAKACVLLILEDMLAEFPVNGWIEQKAVEELYRRINTLSEQKCRGILERVKQRLI